MKAAPTFGSEKTQKVSNKLAIRLSLLRLNKIEWILATIPEFTEGIPSCWIVELCLALKI